MSDAPVSPFELGEREILLRSLKQFQKVCDEQQTLIIELQEQLRNAPIRVGGINVLEAEIERLRQENAVLRMKLEDAEL